jgi:hypothetical protein
LENPYEPPKADVTISPQAGNLPKVSLWRLLLITLLVCILIPTPVVLVIASIREGLPPSTGRLVYATYKIFTQGLMVFLPYGIVFFLYLVLTRPLFTARLYIIGFLHYGLISAAMSTGILYAVLLIVGVAMRRTRDYVDMFLIGGITGLICGIVVYTLWQRSINKNTQIPNV